MNVTYISTRGQAPETDFRGVTMAGLAPDGGLYVPKIWPRFSAQDIKALVGLPYAAIAERILKPFVGDALSGMELRRILDESYAMFDDPAVTPLKKLDGSDFILELFHGPTLAFKDIALQVLGRVFEHFLAESGEPMTVLGATSGDTGSAAIAALAGRKNVDVFILYPAKGPSDIQRKQMTCVDAPNVHALAVDGSFDDCQALVKAAFNDEAFRDCYRLGAVNSINMLRILAQMVYYFAAYARLGLPKEISFVVPTGNFGDIYAGYAARKGGLPLSKLVVASNANDILPRFFASGQMKVADVSGTLSPSMDIQVSSNFERLLFDLCDGDAAQVRGYMGDLAKKGAFAVTPEQLATARTLFASASVGDAATLRTIKETYAAHNYVADPHTAVGIAAAQRLMAELKGEVVMLATAHPAKFPEAIKRATGVTPELPPFVASLMQKPERTALLPNNFEELKRAIAERVKA